MGPRIAVWEARAGEPLGPWLRRKYIDELWSYRQLGAALGIASTVTLRNLLRRYGIAPRTRSESAAAAWASNPARRYRPRSRDAASASTP